MSKTDGGLSDLFRKALGSEFDFQRIESWSTGQGTPDLNGCGSGQEFWIEMKQTAANAVKIDPEQVAWAERRLRAGGRVFLAVRQKCEAGPRREARDRLYIFRGSDTRVVKDKGICGASPLFMSQNHGPRSWDWTAVKKILIGA